MGHSTRKERDKMAIRLALEYLTDGDLEYRFGELSRQDIIDGLNHALGGPAPPWWAEVFYEHRAERREYREEAVDA